MILLTYFIWVPVAFLAFAFAPRRYAPWLCLIGGWVLLPPAVYPAFPLSDFPFWIIGGSLPSNVIMNKAWVAPVATCLASLFFDARRWRHTSLRRWDAPLAAFCLWPIVQQAIVGHVSPSGWISSLYLAGSWALPWWLGRLYLRTQEDVRHFAAVLAGVMLLLLPIAIFEGASEMRLQTLLFGEHPFASDGVQRYAGYRPQALFEHGNQYALWCATATVAAFWLGRERKLAFGAAAILGVMTLASQSVGAIGLMLLGIFALTWAGSFSIVSRFGIWIFLILIAFAGLLVAGILPLRELVEHTGPGQALLDAIRSTGRGSFAWRVSQDLKAAPLLREHLLIGHGVWDWFLTIKSRPWGFPLLVAGQFGLIGLALLLLPLMHALWNAIREAAFGNHVAKLTAILLVMAGLDAILNSFLFWPFIVLASGLSNPQGQKMTVAPRPAAKKKALGYLS